MDRIIIGIDPSYARTGVCFVINGEIENYYSVEREGKTRVEYRSFLRNELLESLTSILAELDYTQGFKPKQKIIKVYIERNNTNQRMAIMASSELIATLEDFFFSLDVEVTQVSASSWQSFIGRKAKDVELYKDERKPKKMPVIRYVEDVLGIDCSEVDKNGTKKIDNKGRVWYNDDMADAICLAIYGEGLKK